MEKKHGGKRPGAGRPPNPKKSPGRFVFRCTDEEYAVIKRRAEERKVSINRYLVEKGTE
jgi:predicted HicB family RNase H-like nuclease